MNFETLGRLLALVAIVAAGPMTVILPSTSSESRSKPKSLLKRFLGHPPIDRHRSNRLRRCLDRFDQFGKAVFDHPSLVKGIGWQNLGPLIRGLHPRTAETYRRFVFFFCRTFNRRRTTRGGPRRGGSVLTIEVSGRRPTGRWLIERRFLTQKSTDDQSENEDGSIKAYRPFSSKNQKSRKKKKKGGGGEFRRRHRDRPFYRHYPGLIPGRVSKHTFALRGTRTLNPKKLNLNQPRIPIPPGELPSVGEKGIRTLGMVSTIQRISNQPL